MKRFQIIILEFILFGLLVSACSQAAPEVPPIIENTPTNFPELTSTSTPTQFPWTATPLSTPTPLPTATNTPIPTLTPLPTHTPTDTPAPTATSINSQQLVKESQRRLRNLNSLFFRSEQILTFEDVEPPYIFKEQCRWEKPEKLHCFQIMVTDIDESTGSFQLGVSELLSAGGIIWKNMGSIKFAPIEESRAGGLHSDPAAFDVAGTTFLLTSNPPVWEVASLEGFDPFPPFLIHEPHEADGATQRPNDIINGVSTYQIDFVVEKELVRMFTERPIPSLLHFDPPNKENARVLLWVGVDDLLPRRISYLLEEPESSLEWRFEYGAFDEPYEFPDIPD